MAIDKERPPLSFRRTTDACCCIAVTEVLKCVYSRSYTTTDLCYTAAASTYHQPAYSNMQRFADCTVVVTGGAASGGIGNGVVRQFFAEGARVGIIDISVSDGEALVDELNSKCEAPRAMFVKCDVSQEDEVTAAFSAIEAAFGTVDCLVCMAAAFVFREVHLATSAEWDKTLNVNVKGSAFCCRAVIPGMRSKGKGAIVLTSSITAHIAFPSFVPYSASKAAIVQMARDVALDNGRFNIRVNCIAPGPIYTTGGTVSHAAIVGRPVEEIAAELGSEVSLRRMGTVDECAKCVLFLCSDDASYVTGTTLHVDGGFTRK